MKKFIGLFLSLVLMMSTMAVTASAATFSDTEAEQLRAQITAMAVVDSANATDEVILPNHFDAQHAKANHNASVFAACNHVGTEKVTSFVGNCYCGSGWVYEITCKPCGAFVGAMCTNPSCGYWG